MRVTLVDGIQGARIAPRNGKIMALMKAHKGQKSIGIFSLCLVVYLIFF